MDTSSQVSSSAADLATAQAGVTAAQRQLDAARAQLQETEANNTRAQADLVRYRALVAKDEVSQQIYDQADATAKANAAAVERRALRWPPPSSRCSGPRPGRASGRSAAICQHRAAAGGRDEGPGASGAGQRGAKARGARSSRTELAILHRGRAGERRGEQKRRSRNERAAGANAALHRAARRRLGHREFQGNATPEDAAGQRVTIEVDAYGREYNGHVDSIAGASGARFSLLPPENATGNYVKVVQRVPVKIVLDPGENKDHLLRAGHVRRAQGVGAMSDAAIAAPDVRAYAHRPSIRGSSRSS